LALLAPRGSLLIFEQPELHLHPKVQARLADFFLSMALSGKQTLAETHSEYLIDRFRLRVALATDLRVKNMLSVLFSERENGVTNLIPIEISEYGAVLKWPKEFFDQSQSDVARILQAASAKRRRFK
jgi:predicted ATPase